jgi:hypothetical protein
VWELEGERRPEIQGTHDQPELVLGENLRLASLNYGGTSSTLGACGRRQLALFKASGFECGYRPQSRLGI